MECLDENIAINVGLSDLFRGSIAINVGLSDLFRGSIALNIVYVFTLFDDLDDQITISRDDGSRAGSKSRDVGEATRDFWNH